MLYSCPPGSRTLVAGVALLAVAAAACAGGGEMTGEGASATGEASYYADKFAGRETASGDIYDPDEMTAAHRQLPFGTRVRVTRLDRDDEPSVVVRINDRGPFAGDRIIDLSKAAARRLDMIAAGVVPVRVTVLDRPASADTEPDPSASGRGW